MLKYKKYIILLFSIILINLLSSMIYLITNIPYNIISSITIILYLLWFIVLGFILAKKSNKKGIVIGSKTGILCILFLIIISLIFKIKLDIKNILYYLLILLSVIFGSIISKNIKR